MDEVKKETIKRILEKIGNYVLRCGDVRSAVYFEEVAGMIVERFREIGITIRRHGNTLKESGR